MKTFAIACAASCSFAAAFNQPSNLFVKRSHNFARVLHPRTIPTSSTFQLNAESSLENKKVVGSLPDWDPTNWTPKRLWNTFTFRICSIFAVLLALTRASSTGFPTVLSLGTKTSAFIHLLSYGVWTGSVFYTTFIAGITMFKNLPRQMFGKLQSKLFPQYFNLCALTILLQLFTLPKLALAAGSKKALVIALTCTLLNSFYLEPKSTKIMFQRYEIENSSDGKKDSPEYKALASEFGKLHGMSSLVNLIALCGAVAQGFYLSMAVL